MEIIYNFEDIKEIKIINQKGGLTAAKVKALYDPDALINLTLYDTATMQNITKLRASGEDTGYLFCDDGLVVKDNKLQVGNINEKSLDFVSGSPNLLKDGEVNIDWGNKYSSYIDGVHLRSAIGVNDDKIIMYNSKDSISIKELANRMKNLGCNFAINLDGGGSCHLESKSQEISKSLRSNVSWLLVYLKDTVKDVVKESETKPMIFGLNAGHGISGSKSIGARTTLACESTENRNVINIMAQLLIANGHQVVDCTIDYPDSASDCINKIVNKANAQTLDMFVSVHFNAGASNLQGNGVTTGTEVYTYSATSSSTVSAKRVVDKIASLGFRNRGVKHSTSFGVLRSTKAPSMLVECCFVDDKDDMDLYDDYKMAKAIVEGLLNTTIKESSPVPEVTNIFRVQVGAFGVKENAEKLANELKGKGYSVVISTQNISTSPMYRVQVGAFGVKENAIKLSNELEGLGYKTVLA